jgi:hypothetical protein
LKCNADTDTDSNGDAGSNAYTSRHAETYS